MYQDGEAVPKDLNEAAQLFRKGADQGNAHAQVALGILYMTGHGVAKDWKEAARWFRKAADQGDATGQFNLGSVLQLESGDSPQDLSEAARWYRKSADQGNAFAQQALGALYSLGQGVPEDKVSAYMWMTLASGGMQAGSSRDELAKKMTALAAKMTPQEIAQAQNLARQWKPSGK